MNTPFHFNTTQYFLIHTYNNLFNDPLKLPYVTERSDTDIFDGLSIEFNNDWFITSDDENTYWWTTEDNVEWKRNDGEKYVLLYCKRYRP